MKHIIIALALISSTFVGCRQTVPTVQQVDTILKQIVDTKTTDPAILLALTPFEGKVTFGLGRTPREIGEMLIEANKVAAIKADPQTRDYALALGEFSVYGTLNVGGQVATLCWPGSGDSFAADVATLKAVLGAEPPQMRISGTSSQFKIETFRTEEVLGKTAEITLNVIYVNPTALANLVKSSGVALSAGVQQALAGN